MTVSSKEVRIPSEEGLICDNDTLRIIYRFDGLNGPVRLEVKNKTDLPIEIDWKKSALVVNGVATSYYSPNLKFSGGLINNPPGRFPINTSYSAAFSGDILVQEPKQFIPPGAVLSKIPVYLPIGYQSNLGIDEAQREGQRALDNYYVKYRKKDYTEETTPLKINSYLYFNVNGEESKEFSMQHAFYVSRVLESSALPRNIQYIGAMGSNVFHVSR